MCDLGDPDIDGDGLLNEDDKRPSVANPDQKDKDNNGEGDACVSLTNDGLFCVPVLADNDNVSVICL